MIAATIQFLIANLPTLLLFAALLAAAVAPGDARTAEHYLSWFLVGIGAEALCGSLLALAAVPGAASAPWTATPVRFDMVLAELTLGVAALMSFRQSLERKAALVMFLSVLSVALACGQVHEITSTGTFAPANAGALLVLLISKPPVLVGLLMAAWWEREETVVGPAPRPAHA